MKQDLTEALGRAIPGIDGEGGTQPHLESLHVVFAAARLVERLLPGDVWPCEHGFIYSHVLNPEAVGNPDLTPVVCVGRQVWDEGIVEAVAVSIWNGMGFTGELKPVEGSPCFDAARAALSAIAQLAEEET